MGDEQVDWVVRVDGVLRQGAGGRDRGPVLEAEVSPTGSSPPLLTGLGRKTRESGDRLRAAAAGESVPQGGDAAVAVGL